MHKILISIHSIRFEKIKWNVCRIIIIIQEAFKYIMINKKYYYHFNPNKIYNRNIIIIYYLKTSNMIINKSIKLIIKIINNKLMLKNKINYMNFQINKIKKIST
jgi:hypothetical protein